MKNGFLIFLATFAVLGSSWCAFVVAPELQLGTAKQTTVLNSADPYPVQRTGDATLGLQVYRANGCAACHTEQLQQDGVVFDVVLTGAGKTPTTLGRALAIMFTNEPPFTTNQLPKYILQKTDYHTASAASEKLANAGGKVETRLVTVGTDMARGWGIRHSVAEDFLYDYPVQLGSLRTGPDLANVGARSPNANFVMTHLYAPQSTTKGSLMPPFRYLFEVKKSSGTPSPDALALPKEYAPADGYEVVPTSAAKQLAAYVLSLRADAPLYDAPFTPALVPTNAPAK